jgi:hypothetical protein
MIIDWVRHAESCANYLDKKMTDEYSRKEMTQKLYDFIDLSNENDKKIFHSNPYKKDIRAANKSLNRLIDPWIEKIENSDSRELFCKSGEMASDDNCWKNIVVPNQKKSNELKLAALAYYIKNQMIKSSWLFHPNLSYIGMRQAQKLGEFLKHTKYDLILTSATIRTITTAILSKPNSTIIVFPFMNEIENDASIVELDRANIGLDPNIIDKIIRKLMSWLLKFQFIQRAVKVDTTLYKKICSEVLSNNPRKVNLEAFLATLNLYSKPTMKILAFSHGKILKQLASNYKVKLDSHPNNTMIYRENFKNNSFEKIYDNSNIRAGDSQHEVETFLQETQMNTCGLNSLRGDLNKIIMNLSLKTRSPK